MLKIWRSGAGWRRSEDVHLGAVVVGETGEVEAHCAAHPAILGGIEEVEAAEGAVLDGEVDAFAGLALAVVVDALLAVVANFVRAVNARVAGDRVGVGEDFAGLAAEAEVDAAIEFVQELVELYVGERAPGDVFDGVGLLKVEASAGGAVTGAGGAHGSESLGKAEAFCTAVPHLVGHRDLNIGISDDGAEDEETIFVGGGVGNAHGFQHREVGIAFPAGKDPLAAEPNGSGRIGSALVVDGGAPFAGEVFPAEKGVAPVDDDVGLAFGRHEDAPVLIVDGGAGDGLFGGEGGVENDSSEENEMGFSSEVRGHGVVHKKWVKVRLAPLMWRGNLTLYHRGNSHKVTIFRTCRGCRSSHLRRLF